MPLHLAARQYYDDIQAKQDEQKQDEAAFEARQDKAGMLPTV